MPKFRTKIVEVEACRLPRMGGPYDAFLTWAAAVGLKASPIAPDGSLLIETLEGVMRASPEDWIIKGLRGEFYPCKPDVFQQKYEEVEE